MSKYKTDIMNYFSEAERMALKLFCQAINRSDADVFIIMAHKAVRLIEVLIDQGYIDSSVREKLVISHEALDFDYSSLPSRKLAIVDDIVISGTSIASVVNRLIRMGIAQDQIQIITLATDSDYFAMQFDNDEGKSMLECYTKFCDAECIALSATISESFNAYGIPYDVDFPDYTTVELSDEQMPELFKEHLWDVKRVENNAILNPSSDGYTFFPRDVLQAKLWKELGADISNCAALKIRAYVERLPNGVNRIKCIPMCLFRGVTTETLNELYTLWLPQGYNLSLNSDNIVIAKMRYVQFYVAHRLFEVFLQSISLRSTSSIIENSVRLLFGDKDGETVYKILVSPEPEHKEILSFEKEEYDAKCLLKEDELNSFQTMVKQVQEQAEKIQECDHEINSTLIMPFTWWYDNKEIPVRKQIREGQEHYVRDWDTIKDSLTRLKHGFPMTVLLDIFGNILQDYNFEELLSLFIDRAVDKGIIVPTIYFDENRNFISRAYRHGEDLPFALADQCRLVYFIETLKESIPDFDAEKSNSEGIAATSVEKMIVLFYQMGLKKGTIFNRFLGFRNIKLLKPFLSVHGKINAIVEPKDFDKAHVYSEKDEKGNEYIQWLTKWLWKQGILKSNYENEETKRIYHVDGHNTQEFLDKNERSCMSDAIKDDIATIANMLSAWYNAMAAAHGKDEFKEDAIILSSCADPATYASAIATEIHYFSKFWTMQCQKVMKTAHSSRMLFHDFSPNSDNYLQAKNTETALHSGRDKVRWYNAGRATEVYKKVKALLNEQNIYGWPNLWTSSKLSSFPALKSWVDKAIGYLYFYSSCFYCFRSEEFWEESTLPKNFAKYKEDCETLCRSTSVLEDDLFQRLEAICKIAEFDAKKEAFDKLVHYALTNSEDVVKGIEEEITSCAQTFTVTYESSLIVDIEPISPDDIDSAVMTVWDSLPEDVSKTRLNIVKFPGSNESGTMIRYGFFYGYGYGPGYTEDYIGNSKELIYVFDSICNQLNARVYSINAIILPRTPTGIAFQHNVERNLVKTAEKFEKNVVEPLLPSFGKEGKKRMTAVLDPYVPKDEFLNCLSSMRWDYTTETERTFGRFENVWTFYNKVLPNTHQTIYSTVHIKCGDKSGMGVLVRLENRVICVSCKHLFDTADKDQILAWSRDQNETSFALRKIEANTSQNRGAIQAANELEILEPDWKGNTPFDVHSLLTLDDFDDDMQAILGHECMCYGGNSANGARWCHPFIVRGHTNDGYMQTEIDPSGRRTVEEGYSGGIIQRTEDSTKIIGIHEGRIGETTGNVIPSSIIKEVIGRLFYEKSRNPN